jgi:hypothetical protein
MMSNCFFLVEEQILCRNEKELSDAVLIVDEHLGMMEEFLMGFITALSKETTHIFKL